MTTQVGLFDSTLNLIISLVNLSKTPISQNSDHCNFFLLFEVKLYSQSSYDMKYMTFLSVNIAKYLDPVKEQIEFCTVFPL